MSEPPDLQTGTVGDMLREDAPNPEYDDVAEKMKDIVDACYDLFLVGKYQDITVKDIMTRAASSRTYFYRFFRNKNEVFVAMLLREFELWRSDLSEIHAYRELDLDGFARGVAASLDKRPVLLKILSMNIDDLESDCRLEVLVDMRRSYWAAARELVDSVKDIFGVEEETSSMQVRTFMCYLLGVHSFTNLGGKSLLALEMTSTRFYEQPTVYDMIYSTLTSMAEWGRLSHRTPSNLPGESGIEQ